MRVARSGLVSLMLVAVIAQAAIGQQEPRLAGRVPAAARAQVESILATARAGGLPVEPLVDRALEGAAKGAPPAMIVAAVTRLRDELLVVRTAFGAATSTAELTAGASALRAGATVAALEQLRGLRVRRPLTVAAAVMADLVAAGVPADTAVGAVLALAHNADDADYVAFRRNVQQDIGLGASPAAALAVRIRSAINSADAASGSPQTGSNIPPKRKP